VKRAIRENFDASASAYVAYEERTDRFQALAAALAAKLVALDASPGMLAANPSSRRVLGDFDRLPFHSKTFDAVAFTASLFLVPDPTVAASEARRVLQPGGVVGAVALDGWYDGAESALAVLDRESRSPSDTASVVDALGDVFTVETGTLSFETDADDLRAFHGIPAIAARFFPRDPPAERVEKVRDLLAPLDGSFEQRWRWVIGMKEA
jgi:SAM-dependent methyltransferase